MAKQGTMEQKGMRGIYNVSFCYLPFTATDAPTAGEAYALVRDAFNRSDAWKEKSDDIGYLFRYICEKYDMSFPDCQCHHYRLFGDTPYDLGLGKLNPWRTVRPALKGDLEIASCRVVFTEIHCYVFSTSVNVLVFKVRVETDDPLNVPTILSHLKNVRVEGIVPCNDASKGTLAVEALQRDQGLTLLDLGERILEETGIHVAPRFFFYANERKEHMNVLMHVEAAEDVDAERALYYLSNCYSRSFDYDHVHEIPTHMHWASPTTAWGYSSEALACLTIPCRSNSERAHDFVMQGFRFNFVRNYQFLYLMLLHQKYEYYRLLMKIGAGERRNRDQLEQFRRELEVFRANFVFARVSETTQYQVLYDAVAAELRLSEMDRDVSEPIRALRLLRQEEEEARRQAEEDAERESDRRIGEALNTFTLLAGISALFDGLELVNGYLPLHEPASLTDWASIALSVILVVLMARAARELYRK